MYASLLMKNIKSQEKINRGVNEVINAASEISGITPLVPGKVHLNEGYKKIISGLLSKLAEPNHKFNDGEWIVLLTWWGSASKDPQFCIQMGMDVYHTLHDKLILNPVYLLGANPERYVETIDPESNKSVGVMVCEKDEAMRIMWLRRMRLEENFVADATYSLIYQIDGEKTKEHFDVSGKDLIDKASQFFHTLRGDVSLDDLRKIAATLVTLRATQRINPRLLSKDALSRYCPSTVKMFKKAERGNAHMRSLVGSAVCAYMALEYLDKKCCARNFRLCCVFDSAPSEEYFEKHQSNWMHLDVTKNNNYTSFEQFKYFLKNGIRKVLFYKDKEAYMKNGKDLTGFFNNGGMSFMHQTVNSAA